MEKVQWIKDLVNAEKVMEESGIVDMTAGYDPEKMLFNETVGFLNELKATFVEATALFNELKNNPGGRVKIYGISKTHADFMIFRHGFKLIFSMLEPGKIGINFDYISSTYIPQSDLMESKQNEVSSYEVIEARPGAFGYVEWTYKGKEIRFDSLVRYYLSKFLQESAK